MTPVRRPSLLPGLCSVTLRDRTVPEVVSLAAAAGLRAVEWGGDVHVPPGDRRAAGLARRCSEDAGLDIVSYGSYLQCTASALDQLDAVLDSAESLETTAVRVWGPSGVEADAAEGERAAVADAVARVAEAAAGRGIDVYLEFHGGTITATAASAVALLDEVDAPNLFCAWQPPYWAPQALDADLADLASIGRRLAHLHVYQWRPDGSRRPLADGADTWPARLATSMTQRSTFAPRAALLEFVARDDPVALAHDASTLLGWLAEADPREDT